MAYVLSMSLASLGGGEDIHGLSPDFISEVVIGRKMAKIREICEFFRFSGTPCAPAGSRIAYWTCKKACAGIYPM
jgi:hypothetical protein